VLPLLLLLLFGIIDGGRWMWTYNRAEKATQMGARFAIVADPVSSSIDNSYIGSCSPALTQGDLIPADCFSRITCTDSGCGSDTGTFDQAAFRRIVDRMKLFLPNLAYSNVSLEYSSSGLGYAGNPNGPDMSPLVTVKIGLPATPLQFTPITTLMLATMTMPSFTTSLTAEDLSGSQSN
jgi:Flp pilus assembly protein TadG